jgi:hypothetical protein
MAVKSIRTSIEKQSATDIVEDSVRIAAYYIWEKDGRPDGEHLRHWYLAMAELSADDSSPPKRAAKKTNIAKRKKISPPSRKADRPSPR